MYRCRVDDERAELPETWRTVSVVSWVLTAAAVVAVAVTSRTIGRPVWWLGPTTRPTTPVAILAPLACIVVPLLAAFRRPDLMVRAGVAGSIGLLVVALLEFLNVPSVAVAMTVVAVASLLASIALVLGTRHYR